MDYITRALFVVNLEPKKMMGEVSEGMLFDIGYPDKIMPVLAVPEKPFPMGQGWGENKRVKTELEDKKLIFLFIFLF